MDVQIVHLDTGEDADRYARISLDTGNTRLLEFEAGIDPADLRLRRGDSARFHGRRLEEGGREVLRVDRLEVDVDDVLPRPFR